MIAMTMTMMVKEVTLIICQRDPVDCYESNYVYMGLQKAFKMDVNKFAQIKVQGLFFLHLVLRNYQWKKSFICSIFTDGTERMGLR